MANNVNANINVNVDTSSALASLQALQTKISDFNRSIVQGNAQAVAAQKSMITTLAAQVAATKQFSTSMVNVESSVSQLGRSIDKNKLSLGEYFRYGVASSKTFGSVFRKEHNQIMELATDRVKRLQTQYIALGEAQNGMTRAMAVRPMNLFNADAAIGIQRQQLFNKLLHDGSTSLINFGKNTQWAGRQLMVGFTVPLTIFGGVAGQIFMDLERQVVNFRRVYGDAMTPAGETNQMVEEIQNLGKEFTKYGIAVKDTVGLAADVAAAGAQGDDLVAATAQSTRLATLGMIEMNQAMTATMALQTAFKLSNEELAQSVDFLNAVENQTVLSLDDVTQAIPRVAPVIQGLGGDVQDLAIFLTAMREGGVSAAEGANALKSGLASLINPTKAAKEQLKEVGININAILSQNKGDIRAIVTEFGAALGELDKFERQQTLAKVFGKYQFARLGALFENISTEGSQAQRVVDLTAQSFEELGALAEKELGAIEESVGMKFTGAVERLKLAIAPIGEVFLRVATPIIDVVSSLLDKFNELSPGVKQFITVLVAGVGVVVPTIIMLVGLFGNFIGQAIKGFALFNNFFNRLRGGSKDLEYLTSEQLDAAAAAASLEGKTNSLTSALNVQRSAVSQLSRAYKNYTNSAKTAVVNLPQAVRSVPATGMAKGGVVPGVGNKDTVPALLTPGESVITKEATAKYGPILEAMNNGGLPGFKKGIVNIGGQEIELDVSRAMGGGILGGSGSTIAAIQNMFNSIPESAEMARLEFVQLIQDISVAQSEQQANLKIGVGEIQSMIRGMGDLVSEELQQAARETKYSAPSGIASQTPALTSGWSTRQEEIDAIQARVAREWGNIAQDSEKMGNLVAVQASHIRGGTEAWVNGMKVWNPENLTPDLGAVNNYLNRIKSVTFDTAESYQYLEEVASRTGMSAQEVLRQIDLLKDDFHPITQESLQVVSSLSEIDNRLSLAAVESKKARTAIGTLAKTGYQAAAAAASLNVRNIPEFVSTINQRAYSGPAYIGTRQVSPEELEYSRSQEAANAAAGQVSGSMRKTFRTGSPAEEIAEIGDDVDAGLAKGIKRSAQKPVDAAADMAKQVKGQLAMDFDDVDALFPAAPYVGERKLLDAPQPTPAPKTMESFGATMAPLSVRRSFMLELDKASEEVKSVAKQSGIVSRGLKNFGSALKNGSAKLTGAMFALDGMVFGLSMMDNGIGQIAQQILPVVFGLQGLQMILPLLMNPIGATIAALVAVGAGLWMTHKAYDEMKDRAKELSKTMYGANASIKETAEFFGNQSFSERANNIGAVTEGVTQEDLSQAQEYMTTDAGKKLVDDLRTVLDNLGSDEAARALKNNLQRMILDGAVTPEQAKALASALGQELGNMQIGTDARLRITEMIGPDGKITSFDERLKIVADIIGDASSLQDAMTRAGYVWDGSSWFAQIYTIVRGEGTLDIFAESAAEDQISKLQVIKTEMDRLNVKLSEGSISLEKYRENMAKLIEQREGLSFASAMDEAALLYGEDLIAAEQAQDRLAQGFADALTNSVAGLGKKAADEFIQGFDTQMSLVNTTTGNLEERNIDILNAQTVREQLNELDSAIARKADFLNSELQASTENSANWTKEQLSQSAERARGYQADIDAMKEAKKNLEELQNASLTLGTKLESGIINLTTIQKLLDRGMKSTEISLLIDTQYGSPEAEAIVMASLGMAEEGAEMDFVINVLTEMNGQQITNVGDSVLNVLSLPSEVSMPITLQWSQMSPEVAARSIQNMTNIANASLAEMDTAKEVKLFMKDEFSSTVSRFEMDWDWIASLDPLQKYVYFNYITTYETRIRTTGGGTISANAADNTTGLKPGEAPVGTVPPEDEPPKEYPPPKDPGPEPSGGGSEESWLESYLKTLKANDVLFNTAADATKKYIASRGKFFGALQQLRKEGIPSGVIAQIGTGVEGLKNARELLNATAEERRTLLKYYGRVVAGEAAEEIRVQTTQAQIEVDALRNLQRGGASQELKDFVAANEKLKTAFASVKVGTKEYNELVKLAKELLSLEREREELQKSISEKLQDQANDAQKSREIVLSSINLEIDKERNRLSEEFAKKYGTTPEMLEHTIKMREHEINLLERSVARIDDIIEAEQERIDKIQQQIDGKERDIELLERKNELDQREIDGLQRQSELRDRTSRSLQKELEALSQSEEKIKEAYQKRIDALNKVSEINEQIVNQQQQQLDLSKAISEGDIYAATAAAQEMRVASAGFAATQVRSGLEAGMENQISGLRTESGLTREQAEQQILNIQEQNYQTSLLIEKIEDRVFDRNKDILKIKDVIYDLNNDIYNIEQSIVNQETIKKGILDSQIEPLRWANEAQSRLLEDLEKEVDEKTGPLAARAAHMQRHFDITKQQESLNHNIWLQTEAINNETFKAKENASQLAAKWGDVAANAYNAAKNIAAAAAGQPSSAIRAYAGGMIKKYAAGSVVGTGSRDSVSALLTPGEFVVRKAMVDKYGLPMFEAINQGSYVMPQYSLPDGQDVNVGSSKSVANINAPVYNTYDMKFSINGANASADEIANRVMMKMAQVQGQGIRSSRGY